jgi:IPT/TIG domain
MITRPPVTIESVDPLDGYEGTIVTLKGSGFASHIRNNCVVIGGMGACARAEPGSTSTELKVKIGPVARETQGDLLMWPGLGSDLYTEEIGFGKTMLRFSEMALFRNGAPVASAGINFKLTKASQNTFAGTFEKSPSTRVELGSQEAGAVMRVCLPKGFSPAKHKSVDICMVLKEPTLALDFSASIASHAGGDEECLRTVAKTINVNAGLVGENVFADVARNRQTGDLELYVTKPYLANGMIALRFA